MRREQALAERRQEVRDAAREWHRAGAIDQSVLEEIRKAYPDDRARVGLAFRVLLFLFTVVGIASFAALLGANDFPTGALLFLAALGSAALTELQTGRLRRARTGSEEATALLAVLFSVATVAWLIDDSGEDFAFRSLLFAAAVISLAAAWRWGLWIFGALAVVSAFSMLASWSWARLCFMGLGAVLAKPLESVSVSERLAPSQRRVADAALVAVLVAVYLAVHVGSYDTRLLEGGWLFGYRREAPLWPGRWFFIAGTSLLPLVVLAAGIRSRRPLLLRMAVVFGVASLVTLRFYVHVAPLWVILVLSGAAAVALAMLLERYLGSAPGKERRGFTAEPIFENGTRGGAVELGMVAALAPAGSSQPGAEKFQGRGGEFGGGGASGSF